MTQLRYPGDWAAMRQGVYDWAKAAAAGAPVVWGEQAAPAPDASAYVWLRLLVPPVEVGSADRVAVTGLAAVVLELAAGEDYAVTISGTPVSVTADGDPTEAELLAALASAITDAAISGVTAEVVLGAGVQIQGATSLAVGDRLGLRVLEGYELDGVATFSVDALGTGGGHSPEAAQLAEGLRRALDVEAAQEALRAAGWGVVRTGQPRRVPAVMGSRWEDRVGFDLQLSCRLRVLALTDWLESAPIGTAIVGTVA